MKLQNKVAIVTGGGMGMGQAAALRLAQEGAKVVIADVNPQAGSETVAAIQAADGEALFVQTDVSQAAQVERLVSETVRHFGKLDILFNNAAIQLHGIDKRAHELDEEIWDKIQSVNLKGVWLCSKYAILQFLKQGNGGVIINNASPTGLLGVAPNDTAYSSSKGGVYGLTRVMAAGYAKDKIRVNAIVPGPMETPLVAPLMADPAQKAFLDSLTPLGRMGKAHEIAGLLVFLASDDASYCTGGIYMADGGQTAI